jgi:hypothetical protein
MHRLALERFHVDSVLLPYSYRQMQDERYAAEFEPLLAVCAEQRVAVQTLGRSRTRPGEAVRRRPRRGTSRSPTTSDIELAVHRVLGRDGVFLNTVADLELLPHVLAAPERVDGTRPSEEQMDELVGWRRIAPLFV